MTYQTILFETVDAAQFAYNILQFAIEVSLDCNAITYDRVDEELVRWLIQENYCQSSAREKYIYPKPKFVLLVDDDPNFLLLVADYLEFKGLRSFTAESVEEGWQTYHRVKPDIIVSGIAMRSTDCGYRLFQQVRENDLHQPFIFLSGQLNIPQKREKAIEFGADAYFGKPFEPEELFIEIEKLLMP